MSAVKEMKKQTVDAVFDTSVIRRTVTGQYRVALIGCGGSGSAMLVKLARIDRALREVGGTRLDVTVWDGDDVSPTNIVRQPFTEREVGLPKASTLVTRVNRTFGTSYKAICRHISRKDRLEDAMIVSCVDSREARKTIVECKKLSFGTQAWIDLGNGDTYGNFVMGTIGERRPREGAATNTPDGTPIVRSLPCANELWPEIVDPSLDEDSGPTCSSREALESQDLFINETVATHAANLIWRSFRQQYIKVHGGFVNLLTSAVRGIRVKAVEAQ